MWQAERFMSRRAPRWFPAWRLLPTRCSTTGPIRCSCWAPAYNSDTAVAGSNTGAGQSVEERGDALTPPAARGFIDRAVISNSVATVVLFTGEGFNPGETVNLTNCMTDSATADANGAVGF